MNRVWPSVVPTLQGTLKLCVRLRTVVLFLAYIIEFRTSWDFLEEWKAHLGKLYLILDQRLRSLHDSVRVIALML